MAGKSTLNRLEHTPKRDAEKYHKIDCDAARLEALFVDIFLDAHTRPPKEIVLDLDPTDDPIHGEQEGRFFHGYYDCYCYLPLYIFCGRFLLCAKLRPSNIDGAAGAVDEVARIVARIRARWPKVRIVLRGDSGFCREELMTWCEESGVGFVFGLAPNERLKAVLAPEAWEAERRCETTGKAARVFKDFAYRTEKTWSRARRVVGKAEHLPGGANLRFVVIRLLQTVHHRLRFSPFPTRPLYDNRGSLKTSQGPDRRRANVHGFSDTAGLADISPKRRLRYCLRPI